MATNDETDIVGAYKCSPKERPARGVGDHKTGHQVKLTLGGETLMHYAVAKSSSCSSSLLEYLWRCGYPIGLENHYGATPLRIAIRNNHRVLANTLIAMGETLTSDQENPFLS